MKSITCNQYCIKVELNHCDHFVRWYLQPNIIWNINAVIIYQTRYDPRSANVPYQRRKWYSSWKKWVWPDLGLPFGRRRTSTSQQGQGRVEPAPGPCKAKPYYQVLPWIMFHVAQLIHAFRMTVCDHRRCLLDKRPTTFDCFVCL